MNRATLYSWAPAGIMALGVLLGYGTGGQRQVPLETPLNEALPNTIMNIAGEDLVLSPEEARAAGMDDYVLRQYPLEDGRAVNVYVAFYEHQTQGHSIHSPKNCLPGGGWEALSSEQRYVTLSAGDSVPVNKYILQNGPAKVLVLYWYQGRGRVAASEYWVKWDLLRDSALRGRSDEGLIRIVVPLSAGEDEAFNVAETMAGELIPQVHAAFPE